MEELDIEVLEEGRSVEQVAAAPACCTGGGPTPFRSDPEPEE